MKLMDARTRLLAEIITALLLFGTGTSQRVFTSKNYRVVSYEPEFVEPLENVTVTEGREAVFTCVVDHLGGYRDQWVGVAWIKADTKAILAIHNRVITHNNRMNVIHSDHNTWQLKIKDVRRNDSGQYMCQINTDPMKMQVGHLNVVIPPDIIEEHTSGDVMVPEGSAVRLTCRAQGYPDPRVVWRREDGRPIVFRSPGQAKNTVDTYEGSELVLDKVARDDMGAYLCIASNDIPPAVSKRMVVQVHFHPLVRIPNQLVGAPPSTNVTLECVVEASPKSINFWTKLVGDQGPQIVDSRKYQNEEEHLNDYTLKMKLTIKNLQMDDFTSYKCAAKNSLGEVEGNIKLYEIVLPKAQTTAVENLTEDLEDTPMHEDRLGPPPPEDRHRDQGAAPQHSNPRPTKPLPPSRPRNTYAVPYDPTDPALSGTGSPLTPIASLIAVATALAGVWAAK